VHEPGEATNPAVRADDPRDYVEFWPAGVATSGWFLCTACGNTVIVRQVLPRRGGVVEAVVGLRIDLEQHRGDSLQDLTRPPSSLRVASLGQPSPQPSEPPAVSVETTAAPERVSAPPSPAGSSASSLTDDDARTVAALDGEYQAAVKANDAATIDRILADDFVLVRGAGQGLTKADLLKQARDKQAKYERHEVERGTQKVRVWHDTAVVTETVWVKGAENGKPVDQKMSVTATYVRTPGGWRYVSGQASTPGK